jgi:hypothetical protein
MTNLFCTIWGHDRDRHRAWHDSLDWRAYCRRCGVAMILDHHDQDWRLYEPKRDDSPFRKPPPGHESDDPA